MNTSLDSLVQDLLAYQFNLVEQHFKKWPESAVKHLKQKCSFPYCYKDNLEKLPDTQLPPHNLWSNRLLQYEITLTKDEYARPVEIFNSFKCQIIGEYINLYLKTDVCLLAAVVLRFRNVIYETYGLDCCQNYTCQVMPC